ncbi:hypothetical protein [Peribacillus sp. TH16]|uniref:hypothetical protein n=1 Tax=Peribacillus sp. TH16 TaxID=2798482 RepID=UPI003144E8F9
MTHGIEAYVSTLHNSFTDPLAMQSIRQVVENIEKSAVLVRNNGEWRYITACSASS